MASLTITDLDDDALRRLEAIARANGRSVEEEARGVLTAETRRAAPVTKELGWDAEKEERLKRILSLGRKLDEPFDQKAFTDELWNFVE